MNLTLIFTTAASTATGSQTPDLPLPPDVQVLGGRIFCAKSGTNDTGTSTLYVAPLFNHSGTAYADTTGAPVASATIASGATATSFAAFPVSTTAQQAIFNGTHGVRFQLNTGAASSTVARVYTVYVALYTSRG